MLTDEELVQELGAGFRDESAGLRYAGRVPAPRRSAVPWTAVPIAAATAAVVVLPQLGGGGGAPTSAPTPSVSSGPSSPAAQASSAAPVIVAKKLDLAAFEAAVADAPDDWPPLEFRIGVNDIKVPDGADPVDGVAPPTRAWVGTDPRSGLPTLWVAAPTRNEGLTFTASGKGWSADQLVHLLLTGER